MRLPRLFRRSAKSMPSYGGGSYATPPPVISRDPISLLELNAGLPGACNALNARTVASSRLRAYAEGGGRKVIGGIRHRALRPDECKELGLADDSIELVGHPALDLLTAGTPHMDGASMWETVEQYMGALGSAYLLIRRSPDGRPAGLDILPTERVSVVVDEDGDESAYVVDSVSRRDRHDANDVVVFRNPAPGSFEIPGRPSLVGLYGMGAIESCLEECELLRDIVRMERSVAQDPRASAVFSIKGDRDVPPEQVERLTRQFDQYMRKRNGRSAFMPTSIEATPLSITPKDMAYAEGRQYLVQVVANAFGVPLCLLNSTLTSYASSYTAYRSYIISTISPKLRRMGRTLTTELAGEWDDDVEFRFDAPEPMDEQLALRRDEMELSQGAMTIDEYRARRGLGPLNGDNGGTK